MLLIHQRDIVAFSCIAPYIAVQYWPCTPCSAPPCILHAKVVLQAMNVTDLEEQVSQLAAKLATESDERKAAEESVLDLITLHLKVSELRERLAHEMQKGTDLKVGCCTVC